MYKLATALKAYTVLALSYLLLVFFLPANKVAQRDYNLSSTYYHLLLFVIILPYIIIWLGTFYSYGRLGEYTDAVKQSKESKSFMDLTRGFVWLAWGSAATSILSIILNAIADRHMGFHPTAIIIANYAGLIVPLMTYSYIGRGAHSLNERIKVSITGRSGRIITFLFIVFGVLYCYLSFRRLDLHHINSSLNPYFLPTWLMIASIIIPFLYAWFVGFLAAYDLYIYSRHVTGILYKRAMRRLAFGIIAVIASSVVVQYSHSIVPRVGHLSLNSILIVVNVSYVLMITGYVLIALGVRQLHKFEEV